MAKDTVAMMAPEPGEDEGAFMERCQEAGHSESACEVMWEDMGDTATAVATGKAVTVRMNGDVAEVLLYDVIGADFFGEGVTAKTFRAQIKAVKSKVINLRINSPGGSVTEGAAMLNALDGWKTKGRRIEVDVDGIAASAASVVMMAGDVVRVAGNGLVMIHDPYGMVMGGAGDMRRTADLLDKVKGQLIDAYARRPGLKLDRDQIAAAMAAETWYTGQEAVEIGLADSAGAPAQLAAFAGAAPLFAKLHYRHAPQLPGLAEAWAETELRREIAAKLRGAGEAT